MAKTQHVPVLIVGGGGAGLTASMLFGTYGIESLLVSAFPGTSILPKAHVLNQRAMEVFADVGVADAIYARSTPAANMSHTGWYHDVAGGEGAGRLIQEDGVLGRRLLGPGLGGREPLPPGQPAADPPRAAPARPR